MSRTTAVALAVALGASSLAAAAVASADDAYSGKYAGDATFQERIARIPELRRAALATVKRRLALEPKRPDRIRIEVHDALPAEVETLEPTKHVAFETSTIGEGSAAPILIRVHAEFLQNGSSDLAQELVHEMAHAVMRDRMSGESYSRLPKWLREGLALWVAEQGPTRVDRILSSREALDGYDAFLPGLGEGEHDLNRYAEDFLAIDWLERKKGASGIVRLVRALVDGDAPEKAVQAVCGLGFEAFRAEVATHARAQAKARAPDGWSEYGAISKLDRERKHAEVIEAAVEFEKEHRRSPLLGDVLYFRGKAERLTSAGDAAAATLARLAGPDRLRCHFADEALYQLGRVELDRKRPEEAARALESIVRDHPDTSLFDPAAYWLAVALADLGRKDESLRWLDRFERSFPKSKLAAEAKALRERLK